MILGRLRRFLHCLFWSFQGHRAVDFHDDDGLHIWCACGRSFSDRLPEDTVRRRLRRIDVAIHFPRLWRDSDYNVTEFILKANSFTTSHLAWWHTEEWENSPENPGTWVVNAPRCKLYDPDL